MVGSPDEKAEPSAPEHVRRVEGRQRGNADGDQAGDEFPLGERPVMPSAPSDTTAQKPPKNNRLSTSPGLNPIPRCGGFDHGIAESAGTGQVGFVHAWHTSAATGAPSL
jgi:hypothetical protein